VDLLLGGYLLVAFFILWSLLLTQFGEEDLLAVVCQGGGYRVHAGLLGGAAGELKGILDIPPLIHHREHLLG